MSPAERIGLLTDLQRAASSVRAAEQQLARDVAEARQRGLSWRDVGNALGVTGQAAHKRYRSTRVSLIDEPLPHDGACHATCSHRLRRTATAP